MTDVIEGRVFVLTGCASGIGRHLAGVLAERGACVLMTDVHHDSLVEYTKAKDWPADRVRTHALDVRDAAAWESVLDAAVAAWGRIDVLMNVAGVSYADEVHELTPERIDLHIDVNTKGTMYGCAAAARRMVAQGHGHIVNFASLAALIPVPAMGVYNASKFAVRGFSLAMAGDLRPHGVAVTIICPDAVDTPMLRHEATDPRAYRNFASSRVLTIEDIEKAVLGKALRKRPLEVLIPGAMAPLARLTTAFPGISRWLLPFFERQGKRNQQKYLDRLS